MTEISVLRPGDVSYLRIAAPDPGRSAVFYSAVFGWKIRKDSSAFEDATGGPLRPQRDGHPQRAARPARRRTPDLTQDIPSPQT